MTNQDLEDILFDGLDLVTGIEEKLWNAANALRSNSSLKASEYATPVLGLIFLRYASNKFELAKPLVDAEIQPFDTEEDIKNIYIEKCGFYLPENAQYNYLLEGKYNADSEGKKSLQKAIIEAMESIEEYNENLNGTLPKQQYTAIDDDSILENLLKELSIIPVEAEGDLFGKIYEYFLGKFALAEGQKGGQFFTPTSIVKLIVEVIEPYKGKIFDPSCGSGGMFVQSAKFIKRHQNSTNALSVYGQERTKDTVDLAKMNLAVNGLNGDIRNVNSFYEDPFEIDEFIDENGHGDFDYVMANPPFNVKDVVEEKITNSTRFNYYGLPSKAGKTTAKANSKTQKLTSFGNANYLWANIFGASLNEKGRAGFVMANSASDARGVELDVRKNIVDKGMVDVIVAVSSNFFISVTLPITIWFYDKGKPAHRKDKTLFIDARNTYTQVTRAIRTFTQSQLFDISAIVWLYRGETDKYKALVQVYQNALTRWKNGSVDNPYDTARPYEGIQKATTEAQTSLATLHQKLTEWYAYIQPLLAKNISQVIATERTTVDGEEIETNITFAQKLKAVNPTDVKTAYKDLQELTSFADRNLKVKKDKFFANQNIKTLLKKATADFEHYQFIEERITYFNTHLDWHKTRFPEGTYVDVEGLCKMADLAEIAEQNYSLNAGRYVGVALEEDNLTAQEFKTEMMGLHQELLKLNEEAKGLEGMIDLNLKEVL